MKKKRKDSKKFIKNLNSIIYSQQFLEHHRKQNKDFTRKRKMHFPNLILFMLNAVKQSLQKELTNFIFLLKNKRVKNITKSAFCQSRMKLNYTAFIELNDALVRDFYTDNIFKLWKGFRLLAIDGSRIQLPISPEIIEDFGCATNNSSTVVPMAQGSSCYDVLNNMIINSEIEKYKLSEYDLALRHLLKCDMKDLMIYDRGYAATWFMFYHILKKKDFIIRMPRNFIKEVREFFDSKKESEIIEITELHKKAVEQIRTRDLEFKPFKIRLVKVILENGEVEVLATSLLDEEKYPSKEFKWLYGMRWGVETNFDHLKNHLMIENFTGLSSLSIMQDFFANMFLANTQSVIIRDAQYELEKEKKDLKYEYKINTNLSLGFMKDRIIKILMNKNTNKRMEELKKLFKINPSPIRGGRKFPRKYNKSRKRFYMKKKRAV